ncbi:sirohydrochlorin chelatase [Chitinimonas sp. BJB300]|uniref:sirohydrochlorin chelatase n=1 Tax=Chitinimonas sp. BJB300 TaxID=1559339 RepID=UPI000C0F5A7F|nr:CbiX/SirB N-terminal domain-containing protein [Chitinimonas sp. BJB300]PHV11265.1 cobalamin biosynthesis protein CbiX [Chitinimonas sp. BJB300]TSJ90794.1 cobalamin biosynthesis protein CbiX [Chitinimonas sp. BJB300]
MSQATRAVILFAHGARDPQWAEPFLQLAGQVQQKLPGSIVALAFLELMTPSLTDCATQLAEQGVSEVIIVPAFMARGAHLRRDLPVLVEKLVQQFPHIQFRVTAALGEAEPVLAAMADWVTRQ